MSSYQFVNSLASCYAGGQPPQRTGPSPGTPHPSNQNSDYYNPNSSNTTYPTCYSPQNTHYPQHYGSLPANNTMADYTTLHPSHTRTLGNSTITSLNSPGPVATPPTNVPTPQTNLLPNNTVNSSSCKYADSTSANVSSPQDLTTARNSPPLTNVSPTNKGTSPKSTSVEPSTATAAVSQSSSSPASSTSSASSTQGATSAASNGKQGGSGGNPPQIYPWMKRVHLGTNFHLASLQDEGYAFHQAMGMGVGPMQRGLYACGSPYS